VTGEQKWKNVGNRRELRLKNGVVVDVGSWNYYVECKYRKRLEGVPGLSVTGRGMYALDPIHLDACAEALNR
jgi:hypothetical protein